MKMYGMDGSIWLQASDIAMILSGEMTEMAGLLPDKFFDDLTWNGLRREGTCCLIETPTNTTEYYQFRYQFTDPQVVSWLQEQRWLPAFETLIKHNRKWLMTESKHLEEDAAMISTMMIVHGHHFDDQKLEKLRQEFHRLQYQAEAMRTVLGYLNGRVRIVFPEECETPVRYNFAASAAQG